MRNKDWRHNASKNDAKSLGHRRDRYDIAACEDERVGIAASVYQDGGMLVEQFRAAFQEGDFTKAERLLNAYSARVDQVVAESFNGDRCILVDPDDAPCTPQPGAVYDGPRDNGIVRHMIWANTKIEERRRWLNDSKAYADYAKWIDYRELDRTSIAADIATADFKPDDATKIALSAALTFNDRIICRLANELGTNEFASDEAYAGLLKIFSDLSPDGHDKPYKMAIPVTTGQYDRSRGVFPNVELGVYIKPGTRVRIMKNAEIDGGNLVQKESHMRTFNCPSLPRGFSQALVDRFGSVDAMPLTVTVRHVLHRGVGLARMDIPVDERRARSIVETFSNAGSTTMRDKRPFLAVITYMIGKRPHLQMKGDELVVTFQATAKNVSFYPHSDYRKLPKHGSLFSRYAISFPESQLYPGTLMPKTSPVWSQDLR